MLILLCSAAPLCAASPEPLDPDWILQQLVRPVPVSTAFVELRDSALLRAPLRVRGEYRRPDAQTLVREVTAPYRETTSLRGDEAIVQREGKAPKRFSLARIPELAGLQSGFGALLSGDRAQLQQQYTLGSSGTREHWQLQLQPKQPAQAAHVRSLRLYGHDAELRCIETTPVKGEVQRTLLAGAAHAAADIAETAALIALCHGDAM